MRSGIYVAVMTFEQAVAAGLTNRMIRALKLDTKLYEEVEHDTTATKQSLAVIAIVSFAQAIGRGIDSYILGRTAPDIMVTGVLGFVETVIGLALWSYLLYWVGIHIFKATTTPGQIYRTTGFARSPGIFFAIPFLGVFVNIWILVAYIIAARAALDISTGRTIGAAIVSFVPFLFIQAFVGILLLRLV